MSAIWATMKNDPIIKAVTIIILGVLGFGFAFNMMFGQRGSMDGEMSGGYSLNNNLSYGLIAAVKLLLIALVLYAVAAIIRLAGKHLLKGGETNVNASENNSLLKALAVIVFVLLAIGLLFVMFGGYLGLGNALNTHSQYMIQGYGRDPSMMDGRFYGHGMMGGYGYGYSGFMGGYYNGYFAAGNNGLNASFVLVLLLKILLVVSIIGFLIGLSLYLYKNLVKASNEHCTPIRPGAGTLTCPACNASFSNGFKFCPECGAKTN